jgi:hypothetical protein
MSSSVDRPTGSRVDRNRSPSLPRLHWPSEQGRKPQPETNVERGASPDHATFKPSTPPTKAGADRGAPPDRAISKPPTKAGADRGAPPDRATFKPPTTPTTVGSDRGAPADHAAFRRNRSDVEKIAESASARASRDKPFPASPPQRAAGNTRRIERLLQDRFVLEGLRQLGLAIAIVLVLGFVSVRILSPREASVAPSDDRVARAPSSAPAMTASKETAIPLPAGPKLNVEFDRSAPAGQPAPLRLTISDAPEGSTIVISGLRSDTTLSAGENRDVEWRLGLEDLFNLSVIPPKDFVGTMILGVELRLPDGGVAGRQTVKLEWTGEALAERTNEAAQASPPPPSSPSETPAPAMATPEAAPTVEAAKEKRIARAMPPQVETPAQAEAPVKESAAARAEPGEGETARITPCYAKLDGKVVLQGNCRTVWTEGKSVAFESGEKRLSIAFDHGRVWRLKWNGQDKGKIFRRDDCWGNEKAHVCEHGLKAKAKPAS